VEATVIRIWDPFVRAFHWMLVVSFIVCWLSAQVWQDLHAWAGYVAGALALARVVWGFVGGGYARFAQFVRAPRIVLAYLGALARGSEARFVGHNPAGGAMIVALMIVVAATVASGYALTTDAFWGSSGAQRLHSWIAHGLALLVLVHLAGVALASLRHRENLVRAMIFGKKRAPAPGDVA
jgi:cytochrome b